MASDQAGALLVELLEASGLTVLSDKQLDLLLGYLDLFLRWNARTNLSSIRDEDGILRRHFVESIACSQCLPAEISSLLDFGSGGGLPGVPIAICRENVAVTLAESQGKKAAFLQEVVRVLGLGAKVHAGRAEMLISSFDCVTLRAVDRMEGAVECACRLISPGGWLVLMTTREQSAALKAAAGAGFDWEEDRALAGSVHGVIALGRRAG